MPHAQQPQPAELKTDEGLVLVDKLATPDMTMAHLIERLKTQERIMTAQERYGQREIMRGIVCRATGLLQERPCHAGIMNAPDLSHDAGLLGELMAFGRAV